MLSRKGVGRGLRRCQVRGGGRMRPVKMSATMSEGRLLKVIEADGN